MPPMSRDIERNRLPLFDIFEMDPAAPFVVSLNESIPQQLSWSGRMLAHAPPHGREASAKMMLVPTRSILLATSESRISCRTARAASGPI